MRRLAVPLLALFAFACSEDQTDGLAPQKCAGHADCPPTQYCGDDGLCVARPPGECTSDDGCDEGEMCQIPVDCVGEGADCFAKCVPLVCSEGTCPDGLVCIDETCVEPPGCDDDNPCPDGLLCDEGECRPPNSGPCEDDDDCELEDEICVAGECGEAVPCDDAEDCEDGLQCFDGVCRDPCTEDADCAPPLFRCDTDTNECRPGCFNDNQCPEDTICEQFLCVDAECGIDDDCDVANNEFCDGGRCVQFEPCGPNGECPTGSLCDPVSNRCEAIPACRTDRDCGGDAYCENGFCIPADDCSSMTCGAGFECIDNICVPAPCRSDTDCTTMGEICLGGVCQMPPSTDFVVEVRIVSPAGYVRTGTDYRFVAIALDQAGRAVPGVTFDWTSSDTDVATIANTAVATGGSTPGETQIRASVDTALGPVTSIPVTLTNLGPLPMGDVRVAVHALAGGAAVAGAEVELFRGTGALRATTDATGIAVFTGAAAGGDYVLTVSHANYDWVTLVAPTSNDLAIALPPLSRTDRSAGLRGDVDLSQVPTQGGISLSLSGTSMPSPLMNFDAGMLFGSDTFNVMVPMIGSIPLPAANTMSIELMGFPLDLKDTYYAQAQPGLRAAWSFGGRIELGTNGLGPEAFSNFLAAILPFYQRFSHTVLPTVLLQSRPYVVDTPDIDGDGDTTEMVPDWNAFPTRTLTPDRPQNLRYALSVAPLPFVTGGNANTLIVLAGTIVPGLGFVPLGIDGQSDMNGSGIVPSFVTKMAPRHSGLEAGDYAIMAIAIRLDGMGPAGPGSIRLFTTDRLPTAVNLADGWLDSPVSAMWNPTARTVTAGQILGADLYRTSFASTEGGWHVYAAPPVDGVVTIPSAPMALPDRASGATVTFDVVDLAPTTTAGALFDAASGGVVSIDGVTRGVARAVIGEP